MLEVYIGTCLDAYLDDIGNIFLEMFYVNGYGLMMLMYIYQ
jgi:hypothetical protein